MRSAQPVSPRHVPPRSARLRLSSVAVTLSLTAAAGVTALALAPAAGAATTTTATSKPTATKPAALPVSHLVSNADLARVHKYAATLKKIRTCESTSNYKINTGNGYYGAYQFAAATWHHLGYKGLPNAAAPIIQDAAAAKLLSETGTRSWGYCG